MLRVDLKIRGTAVLFAVIMIFSSSISHHDAHCDQLSLVISSSLLSVPSDGRQHPAFFVTIVDGTGRPYLTPTPVDVTVSSSDERVLSVQTKATIKEETYYVIVNASSSVPEKKTVEVSVSASGFQSSKINVVVEPPAGTPKALEVTLLPDVLVPRAGADAEVVVTIVDAYGKPAKARNDLYVTLSSSDIRIADVSAKNLKISKGSFSAETNVSSTGFIGSATITASTSNLKPDSATIKVSGPKPEKLVIWIPGQLLGDETVSAFIGIVDKDLKPAKVPYPVKISLYSSNTTVFQAQDVTIGTDEWCAMAEITSRRIGSATLCALTEDLAVASAKVDVVGQGGGPYALKVYSMAGFFPADERECTAIAVQMVDKKGLPSKAQFTTEINIVSSCSDILDTSSSVYLQAGRSLAYVRATPKLPGSVKVTAGTLNFGASDATVSVYSPMPSTVNVIAPPIPSDGEVEACLVTSSAGLPAPAPQDTQVLLSSSDTRVGDVNGTATLRHKEYYTLFKVRGKSPGQFSLTALGSGIPSISVPLLVHEVRASIFHLSYVEPLAETDFPMLVQVVSSLGSPAVGDENTTINLASSNTTAVLVPETASIEAESAEVLLMARGVSQGKTSVTVSSGGFNSLSINIASESLKASIRILGEDRYGTGEVVEVLSEVMFEGKPLEGITVSWKGSGLTHEVSTTNSLGIAQNTLTVREKENVIEATASIPGAGLVSAQKKIVGMKTYQLEVTSNIGVEIEGSGTYDEGGEASLSAPTTVGMSGLLGLLGGKYNFKQWTGASDSANSTMRLVFGGDDRSVSVQAVYIADYFGMAIPLGAVGAAVSVAAFVVLYLRRRSE